MIVNELYNGQGLGNQLWCYFTTRIIAKERGYDFGIQSSHKFKGKEFMEIDFGKEVVGGGGPEGGPPTSLPEGITNYYKERMSHHPGGMDVSKYDSGLFSIDDNTKTEGCMQSYDYIKNHKSDILSWIKINKPSVDLDDNTCIIHIRGGDFRYSPAIQGGEYYNNAINGMLEINSNMKFIAVTDDPNFVRSILPNVQIFGAAVSGVRDLHQADHHCGGPIYMDYMMLNSAKNVIMSASSFSWWAVWTNRNVINVIAPKYWAANKISDGYWACGDSLVDGWMYLHGQKLYSYDECLSEKTEYEEKNKNFWI